MKFIIYILHTRVTPRLLIVLNNHIFFLLCLKAIYFGSHSNVYLKADTPCIPSPRGCGKTSPRGGHCDTQSAFLRSALITTHRSSGKHPSRG